MINSKFLLQFEHNKTYDGNGEESKALQKFENNNKAIELHNQRNNETFKRGLNEHSDLTYEEKKVMRMGFKQSHDSQSKIKSSSLRRKRSDQPLPDSIDYRSKFTAIKDQKKCGACWAFAANAVLEYQIAVIRNLSVQLSEQELISCDKNNTGCNGGDPFMAYGYVIQNGLASQKDYAKPGVSKECLNKRVKRTTKITDACFGMFVYNIMVHLLLINSLTVSLGGDDESLKWLVANYGAVVVVICATDAFTNYKSGVYYEKNCPTNASKANHAIVSLNDLGSVN